MSKRKLNRKQLEDLKKTMRFWERAKVDVVKHLYFHIDALTEENERLTTDLNKFKQESIFETHDKKVATQSSWPTPSCSYREPVVEVRGTKLQRLKDFERRGLIGSDQWNLNLKHSRLTHNEALELLNEGKENENVD